MANQKYVDPSPVLNTVVDDFGKKMDVGNQMDITEYLLNFIERLEEGLGEKKEGPKALNNTQTPSDGIFPDIGNGFGTPTTRGSDTTSMDSLNESYVANTKPLLAQPMAPKQIGEFTNTISENFFGEQSMVTKLFNKQTRSEKLINRIKDRMGPIMLKLKHGNLVDDWYESSRDQVDDYRVETSQTASQNLNEVCITENWIKEAPNVLFFAL